MTNQKLVAQETLEAYKNFAREHFEIIKLADVHFRFRRGTFMIPFDPTRDRRISDIDIMNEAFERNIFGMTLISYMPLIEPQQGQIFIVYRDDHGNCGFAIFADNGMIATAESFDSIDAFFDGILPEADSTEACVVSIDLLLPIVRSLNDVAGMMSV